MIFPEKRDQRLLHGMKNGVCKSNRKTNSYYLLENHAGWKLLLKFVHHLPFNHLQHPHQHQLLAQQLGSQ